MGAHVVALPTSRKKFAAAFALGTHEAVLSTDDEQMRTQAYRFDFILDTVSSTYPMTRMINALKLDVTL